MTVNIMNVMKTPYSSPCAEVSAMVEGVCGQVRDDRGSNTMIDNTQKSKQI